jgi:leucyl aminopeptidase
MINIDNLPRYLSHILKKGAPRSGNSKTWVLIPPHQKTQFINQYKKFASKADHKTFVSGSWSTWSFTQSKKSLLLILAPSAPSVVSHYGYLEDSMFQFWKNQGGALIQKEKLMGSAQICIESGDLSYEDWLGFLVGIELGCYQYNQVYSALKKTDDSANKFPTLYFSKNIKVVTSELILEAQSWGYGQNLARHLVNLPPGECYPEVVAEYVKHSFKGMSSVKVTVMSSKQLQNEKMGLLYAVGKGSEHEPKFVEIQYLPSVKSKVKKVAIVGKGVTFDTGGLDIKPSSGMRLMKKDMAGAAAVIGSMYYIAQSNLPISVSAYIPLAENSVDAKSMRPSDVYVSRNGLTVEIHNTDAEGRLILADALDYAVTHKIKPDFLIDVATLTGAIKTTLGLEIAGLFSNQDDLAEQLLKAAQESGDLAWRIPLYSRYSAQFSTPFADLVNAVDGWAGPITAALFLEKFVRGVPWAHFDIYGWSDKPSGTQAHAGGNGQMVGLLNKFMRALAKVES